MIGAVGQADLRYARGLRVTPQGILVGYGCLELEIEARGDHHRECLEFWMKDRRVAEWVTRDIESTIQAALDHMTGHERIRLIRSFSVSLS